MATFVQWHFQPAESREGNIMMSISHEYKEFDTGYDKLIRWREKKK